MPSTRVPLSITSAPTSMPRRAEPVSVVKNGLPVPHDMMATLPCCMASMARHLLYCSPMGNMPTAVSTCEGCPTASRPLERASELITVASMPM